MDELQARLRMATDSFDELYTKSRRATGLSLADAEELEFVKMEIQLIQAAALTALARRQ